MLSLRNGPIAVLVSPLLQRNPLLMANFPIPRIAVNTTSIVGHHMVVYHSHGQ